MQKTLFPKDQISKENETPKNAAAPMNVHRDEPKGVERDCSFAVASVTREVASTLQGTQTAFQMTYELELKPYPQQDSCYGGFISLNSFAEDEIQEMLSDLLAFKREVLALPYTEDLRNADRFTNLKASEVHLNMSKETECCISGKVGGGWKSFMQEWNGIPNQAIPEGYRDLVQKEQVLKGEIDSIESRVQQMQKDLQAVIDGDQIGLSSVGCDPASMLSDLADARRQLRETKQKLSAVTIELNTGV